MNNIKHPAYNDAQREALAFLTRQGDDETIAHAATLWDAGDADWYYDPQHAGVIGLLLTGRNRALVVIYLAQDDYEISSDLFDAVGALDAAGA